MRKRGNEQFSVELECIFLGTLSQRISLTSLEDYYILHSITVLHHVYSVTALLSMDNYCNNKFNTHHDTLHSIKVTDVVYNIILNYHQMIKEELQVEIRLGRNRLTLLYMSQLYIHQRTLQSRNTTRVPQLEYWRVSSST